MTPLFRRKRAADGASTTAVVEPRPIPISGIDHIELFVGNVRHTAAYLGSVFGFRVHARQGPDTGVQDLVSLFLVQGQARLLVTSGLTGRHDAAVHVLEHGDSIKDVALGVEDMDTTYLGLRERRIEPLHLPVDLEDDRGRMWICPIRGIGPVLHTFVDRHEYGPLPAPGFVPVDDPRAEGGGTGIESIDTVSMVVQPGTLDDVSRRYRDLFAPERTVEVGPDDTSTDGFSFRAVTLIRPDLRLRLVEPDRRVRRSHLDEFLRLHGGPGVHTITFRSSDLDRTVDRLRAGIAFIDHRGAPGAAPPSGLPIRSDEEDGSEVRHAVTEAIQHRTPFHFEFIEGDPYRVTPAASITAMHAAMERLHRRRLDQPLLPRESAGR